MFWANVLGLGVVVFRNVVVCYGFLLPVGFGLFELRLCVYWITCVAIVVLGDDDYGISGWFSVA